MKINKPLTVAIALSMNMTASGADILPDRIAASAAPDWQADGQIPVFNPDGAPVWIDAKAASGYIGDGPKQAPEVLKVKHGILRRGAERGYDYCVAKKRAHPKIWKASVFGVHVVTGTLQVVATVAGMKR